MQKARRHPITGLRPLVGARFQVLFHSPVRGAFHLSLTVLVRYRSPGSAQPWRMVPPDSDRAPPTPPYSGYRLGWSTFQVRGCHPLRPAFPGVFLYVLFFRVACPTTPRAPRRPRFGLFPFRSPLLGESLLFSFPPTTGMFRFVGFASPVRVMPRLRAAGCPIRTPTDQRPFAPPRGLSRPAASFIASGSQGILRAPCLASRSRLSSRCPFPWHRSSCVLSLCLLSLSHPVKEPRGLQASASVRSRGEQGSRTLDPQLAKLVL